MKLSYLLLEIKLVLIYWIIYTIPNLPAGNQPPAQAQKMCLSHLKNGEEPITVQGSLDEL